MGTKTRGCSLAAYQGRPALRRGVRVGAQAPSGPLPLRKLRTALLKMGNLYCDLQQVLPAMVEGYTSEPSFCQHVLCQSIVGNPRHQAGLRTRGPSEAYLVARLAVLHGSVTLLPHPAGGPAGRVLRVGGALWARVRRGRRAVRGAPGRLAAHAAPCAGGPRAGRGGARQRLCGHERRRVPRGLPRPGHAGGRRGGRAAWVWAHEQPFDFGLLMGPSLQGVVCAPITCVTYKLSLLAAEIIYSLLAAEIIYSLGAGGVDYNMLYSYLPVLDVTEPERVARVT